MIFTYTKYTVQCLTGISRISTSQIEPLIPTAPIPNLFLTRSFQFHLTAPTSPQTAYEIGSITNTSLSAFQYQWFLNLSAHRCAGAHQNLRAVPYPHYCDLIGLRCDLSFEDAK